MDWGNVTNWELLSSLQEVTSISHREVSRYHPYLSTRYVVVPTTEQKPLPLNVTANSVFL
jgi:hypothetical protein